MVKIRNILLLILALGLAGGAAYTAHDWLEAQAGSKKAKTIEMAKVVVVREALPPGHVFEKDDLEIQQWPLKFKPKDAIDSMEGLAGRVTASYMVANEVVTPSKLKAKGTMGGLSAVLKEGKRAMTVKVDEVVGVGGFVQPGDRVDVLATVSRGDYSHNPVTKIMLQDLTVLTVGHRLQQKKTPGESTKAVKVKVVTLEVSPEQGEELALISQEGAVVLALRGQTDRVETKSRGVRLNKLLASAEPRPKPVVIQQKEKKVRVVTRPTMRIELLKGKNKSFQTFPVN